ncbi:glycosyltransferase [Microbacteriaceae bacterium VKM Ac-2855]|nr:glycosyltransferase [Microbacteriaceae bacterium VKM Ac-2855]
MGSRARNNPVEESLDPTRPDELFDLAWYLASYPDIASETGEGWAHFVLHGEREGRSPGPGFDPEFYRRTHLALEADRPFTHYVTQGRARGHAPKAVAVDENQTFLAMRAALHGRLNPILLIGNDARAAGAPFLLLEIAARLRSRGWSPVFVLKQAGPLFARFADLGPTLIADEGWNLPALGKALPAEAPVLANTAWGALVADQLDVAWRSVVLVQEMPEYLVTQDLLAPISRAHSVIVSMPRMQSELGRLLAPESRLETILPGLRAPIVSRRNQRAVRRLLDEQFGAGSPVFLGAGYADRRKGFDLFLETARMIAEREPAAVFVWLGELGSWARSAADQALADGLRLLLPGFRPDASDWYTIARVYVLTSRQDPGPTTVMDAAAVGTPFVGLAADIGLRDLDDIVARTGEFVGDTEALADSAVEVARSDSPDSRTARASFVRAYRSLDGYVDDLERIAVAAAPAVDRRVRSWRSIARARLAVLDLMESQAYHALHAAPGAVWSGAIRKARTLAPRAFAAVAGSSRRRLVSIAVPQSGPHPLLDLPDGTVADPQAAHALVSGDRAWLAAAQLLASMAEPADVHLLRDPDAAPWPLVRELEASAGLVARLRQYDATRPPRWAAAGSPPPRPRRSNDSSGVSHGSVTLAPHASVRLPRSIGVFLHVFYLDVAEQIADRLTVIDHPFRLYVSTDDERKAEAIRRMLPEATVRVVPNRGRDIAPKIFGFAAEHRDHDVVLHLHTKRSPHRSDLGDWLAYLLDCLLPSTEGVNAILAAFAETERVGMISPALYAGLGPTARWGPNRAIAEVVTWGAGWPALPDDHRLAFAAGSMFWARSAALEPLQELAIPSEAFSDSRAADGTLAHAVERLIGVSCSVAGLEQVFVAPGVSASHGIGPDVGLTPAQVAERLRRRGSRAGPSRR